MVVGDYLAREGAMNWKQFKCDWCGEKAQPDDLEGEIPRYWAILGVIKNYNCPPADGKTYEICAACMRKFIALTEGR